jgi:5-methylcytosine-specific restriction endonuclease McrA
MLRRADNLTLHFAPSFWTGKGGVTVTIGKTQAYATAKLRKTQFEALSTSQRMEPVHVLTVAHRANWQFQGRFYWPDEPLTSTALHALLVSRQRKQQQQVDRAQQLVAMTHLPARVASRRAIPEDVKQLVWVRDGGSCRSCGSNVELQFDHLISPLSLAATHRKPADSVQSVQPNEEWGHHHSIERQPRSREESRGEAH